MQQPENITIAVVTGPFPDNDSIAYYTIVNHDNGAIQLWSVTSITEENLEWEHMQTFDNMDAASLYVQNNIFK